MEEPRKRNNRKKIFEKLGKSRWDGVGWMELGWSWVSFVCVTVTTGKFPRLPWMAPHYAHVGSPN